MSSLNGYIGKVKNIPTTEIAGDADAIFTVSRIDYYSSFGNDLTGNFIETMIPTDTTYLDVEYTIDISQGVIEDAQIAISGTEVGQAGEENTITLTFTLVTELEEGSWIRFDIPLLYSYYDTTNQEVVEVYPNEQEGF